VKNYSSELVLVGGELLLPKDIPVVLTATRTLIFPARPSHRRYISHRIVETAGTDISVSVWFAPKNVPPASLTDDMLFLRWSGTSGQSFQESSDLVSALAVVPKNYAVWAAATTGGGNFFPVLYEI